ncbi:hypothetical protein PG989_012227 [Apiospora arundinis]
MREKEEEEPWLSLSSLADRGHVAGLLAVAAAVAAAGLLLLRGEAAALFLELDEAQGVALHLRPLALLLEALLRELLLGGLLDGVGAAVVAGAAAAGAGHAVRVVVLRVLPEEVVVGEVRGRALVVRAAGRSQRGALRPRGEGAVGLVGGGARGGAAVGDVEGLRIRAHGAGRTKGVPHFVGVVVKCDVSFEYIVILRLRCDKLILLQMR